MLVLIAAIGRNNELGKDNKLIWYLPEDLKFFKESTMNKTIVMGTNTFLSLPRLLPNREHIVLSHKKNFFPKEVVVYNNFDELLNELKLKEEDVYIIGGESIYSLFIDYCDKMLLTEINQEYDADKFFPKFEAEKWNRKVLCKHRYEGTDYKHVEYTKK